MPQTPYRSRQANAFTLVELLAVIAIMGVLTALILTALPAIKASSRTAKCMANLRSTGPAFDLFAADHNGYYPAVTYNKGHLDGRVNPNKLNWWLELKPYIGANLKTEGAAEGSAFAICPDGQTGMNANINYYFQTPRATISQPVKTILLGDSMDHVLSLAKGDPTGERFKHSEPQRHRGKANYLFVDGHVEMLDLADAVSAYSRDPYAQ